MEATVSRENMKDWIPEELLRSVSAETAKYSRGFLRCSPDQWFPGLSQHWLPLLHSLNLEVDVRSVKPSLNLPDKEESRYFGAVDDEYLAFQFDSRLTDFFREYFGDSSGGITTDIFLEYIARRMLQSMSQSWSGPESSTVSFHPELNEPPPRFCGQIEIALEIEHREAGCSILLGKMLRNRLDSLWKKQVHTMSNLDLRPGTGQLEVGRLVVAPNELGDFTESGALIDLEQSSSDRAVLVLDGKPYRNVTLVNVEGALGFEVLPEKPAPHPVEAGSIRMGVVIGDIDFSPAGRMEVGQTGAIFEAKQELSNTVRLSVGGEVVAAGQLLTLDDRFVVSIT